MLHILFDISKVSNYRHPHAISARNGLVHLTMLGKNSLSSNMILQRQYCLNHLIELDNL
jgi:hypothetical protein